jgi:hypothetical protein
MKHIEPYITGTLPDIRSTIPPAAKIHQFFMLSGGKLSTALNYLFYQQNLPKLRLQGIVSAGLAPKARVMH